MKKNSDILSRAARALPTILLAAISLQGCSGGDNKPASAAAPAVEVAKSAAGPADPASGKEIYFRYCHFCHGQKGLGDGPVGIALSPHPADFVNDAKRMSKTDNELFKSITEGIHKEIGGEAMSMPRWQDILSDKERWDVLAFIRQLESEGKTVSDKKRVNR